MLQTISYFLLDIAVCDGMVRRVATPASAIGIVGRVYRRTVRVRTWYAPESLCPLFLY